MTEELNEVIEDGNEEFTSDQDEKDFNDGFVGEPDEYEVVEDKGDDAVEDEKEEPEDDKFSKLSETIESLELRLRQAEGRNGSLNAAIQRIEEDRSVQASAGHPSIDDINTAIGDDDALEELREKYPSWSDEIDRNEAVNRNRMALNGFATKDDIKDVVDAKTLESYLSVEKANEIMDHKVQEAVLSMKHPQYQSIIDSEKFKGWLDEQDGTTKKLYETDRAADAIELFDKYAQDTNEVKRAANKRDRLASAVPATSTSRNTQRTSTTDEEDFAEGFGS